MCRALPEFTVALLTSPLGSGVRVTPVWLLSGSISELRLAQCAIHLLGLVSAQYPVPSQARPTQVPRLPSASSLWHSHADHRMGGRGVTLGCLLTAPCPSGLVRADLWRKPESVGAEPLRACTVGARKRSWPQLWGRRACGLRSSGQPRRERAHARWEASTPGFTCEWTGTPSPGAAA